MKENPIDTFFYGLFMDESLLRQQGVRPENPRRAYVEDFALRIGARATLIPSPGSRAYGMLISLTQSELNQLYSAPGLELYRPETVLAHTLDADSATSALCYNLRAAPQPGERNPDYAARLRTALTALNFPVEYIRSID